MANYRAAELRRSRPWATRGPRATGGPAGNRCKQATGKPQPGNCSLLPETRTFLAIPDLSVGREYIVLTPKLPGSLPLAQQGYALLKGWSYRCQISVDPKTQQLRPQA